MTEITLEELEKDFEEIIQRVEEGEHFLITSDDYKDVVMIPYEDYSDYYDEYFEHDDAC